MKTEDAMWLGLALTIMLVLLTDKASAAEYNYSIDTVNYSMHHAGNAKNEKHDGIGFSIIQYQDDGDVYNYGYMRYRNSFGDMSHLLHGSKVIYRNSDIVVALGVGAATGYEDHVSIPVAPFFSIKYGWVVFTHIPMSVTTVGLKVPVL